MIQPWYISYENNAMIQWSENWLQGWSMIQQLDGYAENVNTQLGGKEKSRITKQETDREQRKRLQKRNDNAAR